MTVRRIQIVDLTQGGFLAKKPQPTSDVDVIWPYKRLGLGTRTVGCVEPGDIMIAPDVNGETHLHALQGTRFSLEGFDLATDKIKLCNGTYSLEEVQQHGSNVHHCVAVDSDAEICRDQ